MWPSCNHSLPLHLWTQRDEGGCLGRVQWNKAPSGDEKSSLLAQKTPSLPADPHIRLLLSSCEVSGGFVSQGSQVKAHVGPLHPSLSCNYSTRLWQLIWTTPNVPPSLSERERSFAKRREKKSKTVQADSQHQGWCAVMVSLTSEKRTSRLSLDHFLIEGAADLTSNCKINSTSPVCPEGETADFIWFHPIAEAETGSFCYWLWRFVLYKYIHSQVYYLHITTIHHKSFSHKSESVFVYETILESPLSSLFKWKQYIIPL